MKANELRVNNYVYDNESQDVIQIERGEHIEYITLYDPITLTEEWLLKFDFTRHHADYSNGVIYIKNVPDNTEFEWGVYPNELGSGFQIKNRVLLKYVHQLQNIYFALTGEELKLKEDE